MKTYLLLLLSTLLLLFTLPKNGLVGSSLSASEQSMIRKSCQNKRLVKRTCAKKCLKHQTHSDQQNAANLATDCSQQLFAVVTPLQPRLLFSLPAQPTLMLPSIRKHLSPDLVDYPKPPRLY
ncbi:hypothetical protein [Pontibacter ruber]|uniref:Uncharacterized protein n=1 Tax=Pontibacter ruber TaxID=1343895 RepID=A0ABW5CZT2_9BACT|nr:hypothetical protein [Pontibacter ruber]